jgi:hypothetical protein
VVLRGRDLLVCEDLGRQLREFGSAAGADMPMVVWADTRGAARVNAFLAREHVRFAQLDSIDVDGVLDSGAKISTPAVLLASRIDGEASGIAHSRRFPNVRLRSFAQELEIRHDR